MPGAERFDVAVVGGGSAGVAAAMGSASLGARTLLVERSDFLGGNAALAFVHTICGLYHAADEGPVRLAHAGFPRRFAEGLRRDGAAGEPERVGRVVVLPTRPPRLAAFARALCARTPGLSLRAGWELAELSMAADGTAAPRLRLRRPGAPDVHARADLVVDASGDAAAGALCGADTRVPGDDEVQLPSLIFRMQRVGPGVVQGFSRLRLSHAVAGAVRSGDLPPGCESVLVRPAGEPGKVYVTLNVPRPKGEPLAPLDPASLERLERRARQNAQAVADFLCRTREEFAGASVDAWPARIGVRESRSLVGRRTLSRQDVLAGRRDDDEVALSTWPIELWHDHRRAHMEYPQGASSLPLGALVSRSHPRLAMAGRCLSATHEAHGALRVIGTALASGEAAGVAAALAADAGTDLHAVAAADVRRHIARRAERDDA